MIDRTFRVFEDGGKVAEPALKEQLESKKTILQAIYKRSLRLNALMLLNVSQSGWRLGFSYFIPDLPKT